MLPHKTWIAEHVDGYIVANDDMVISMVQDFGVEPEKIHPVWYSYFRNIFHPQPKARVFTEEMGLDPDKPTVLLMAGSFGVKTIVQIYRDIIRVPMDFK